MARAHTHTHTPTPTYPHTHTHTHTGSDHYPSSSPLQCDDYLRDLSKDLTFLNRFNLHYSSEVCQPTLAKSTDMLTRYFTTRVVQDLDTAVCTLRSMLTSSRAESIGIAVDTSTGQVGAPTPLLSLPRLVLLPFPAPSSSSSPSPPATTCPSTSSSQLS